MKENEGVQRSSPVNAEALTGTRWRHLKRNTTYEVVGIAKLQTALTEELADETSMVVYRNEATHKLSVRALDEFCDGRFEKITSPENAELQLADEIEQSWGLLRIVPGEGIVPLGKQKTAIVIAALRSSIRAQQMPPQLRSELIQLEAVVNDARCSNEAMRIRNTWDVNRRAINASFTSPDAPAQQMPVLKTLAIAARDHHISISDADLTILAKALSLTSPGCKS